MRISTLALVGLIGVGGCALATPKEPSVVGQTREAFAFDGLPISPALVQLFSAFPTEVGPVVHAVDVTAADVSPGFPGGEIEGDWISGADGFAYRVVGRLDDGPNEGTHVLHTRTGSGYESDPELGTGVVERVLFVVFDYKIRGDGDTARVLMRCTGNNPIEPGQEPVIVGGVVELR